MTNDPKIDYELTTKGETFKGTMISRAALLILWSRLSMTTRNTNVVAMVSVSRGLTTCYTKLEK